MAPKERLRVVGSGVKRPASGGARNLKIQSWPQCVLPSPCQVKQALGLTSTLSTDDLKHALGPAYENTPAAHIISLT